jgi:hypothetical protein
VNRSIVQHGAYARPLAAAAVGIILAATAALAQTKPQTQPSPPAVTSNPATLPVAESEAAVQSPPPQCRFDELLRVELRDRKLAVAMVPPKALDQEIRAGRGAPILIADSDAIEWRLSGVGDSRQPDGAYARFAIAPPPDHFPDRWSPLQLMSVTSTDDALEIVGSGRIGRTYVTVQYRQEQALNAARLTVQRSRRAGVGRPLHDFTAADLLQLWNEHQREVRIYLSPLLKALSPRENLLRPRAGDVYRAFDAIPADAEMMRRVAAILPELDAASPAAREAAAQKIEALGPAAVLALLRMDRAEWTPEQTARLATIVQRQSMLADPTSWRRDIYFLTDCLDDADPAVRQSALDGVRAIAGRGVDFNLDAAPEARLAAAQEILRTLESTTTGR